MTCDSERMDSTSTIAAMPVVKSVSEHLSEQVFYENTYKMKPDEKMQLRGVQDLVQKILGENIVNLHYDAIACSHMATKLAATINQKIKLQTPNRFKLVTFVIIGQVNGSTVNVGSRCLWDTRFDHFLEETYQNSSVYIVATVYIMYRE